jgi:hypothetical protein
MIKVAEKVKNDKIFLYGGSIWGRRECCFLRRIHVRPPTPTSGFFYTDRYIFTATQR